MTFYTIAWYMRLLLDLLQRFQLRIFCRRFGALRLIYFTGNRQRLLPGLVVFSSCIRLVQLCSMKHFHLSIVGIACWTMIVVHMQTLGWAIAPSGLLKCVLSNHICIIIIFTVAAARVAAGCGCSTSCSCWRCYTRTCLMTTLTHQKHVSQHSIREMSL